MESSFEKQKLKILEETGQYLFHGSMGALKILEPRQAHNYLNGEQVPDGRPAVFASSNLEYAIFMAIINERNCPRGFRASSGYSDEGVKLFATKETLSQLSDDASGFIHVFDRFLFSPRDDNRIEFVSYQAVHPLQVIQVFKRDLSPYIGILDE